MIGTTTFSLDDNFLDDYVQHVLAWWYGERVARGVTAPLRRRCWYVSSLISSLGVLIDTPSGLANIV